MRALSVATSVLSSATSVLSATTCEAGIEHRRGGSGPSKQAMLGADHHEDAGREKTSSSVVGSLLLLDAMLAIALEIAESRDLRCN